MDIETIKELVSSLGFPIVVATYFLWRDYKFQNRLVTFMSRIITLLEKANGN